VDGGGLRVGSRAGRSSRFLASRASRAVELMVARSVERGGARSETVAAAGRQRRRQLGAVEPGSH
jgi:hypothetical protein